MNKTIKTSTLIGIFLLGLNGLQADNSVNIKMPKVPEVPKVEAIVPKVIVEGSSSSQSNEEILKDLNKEKVVIFSDHVAPTVVQTKQDKDKVIQVGDINKGRVSAYLHSPLMEVSDVEKTLENAGFEIITSYPIGKKGKVTAIAFTNDDILNAAAKKGRGFASTLRLTVDQHNKLVSISNPLFAMKAFLQDSYSTELGEKTLQTLRENFKGLKNSNELLKFNAVGRYQFMEGMPRYENMVVIKEGKNNDLLKKARKSRRVIYEQELSNGSIVLGIELSRRTTKFIKKTGYQNAALLPYPILIEDGTAKILDPKYYIAVMYPKLKMSQFMTISTIPGAINKEINRIFR